VHVPSDGVPLKGYELAKADIERRSGDDAATVSKPSFLAALFRGKSSDDEDEAGAPDADDKPSLVMVSAAARKPADTVPAPRARPQLAATLQLASADSAIVQPVKPKQQTAAMNGKAEARPDTKPDTKPETPADIINARGFWGDDPAKQATPAEAVAAAAAISARRTLDAADPQTTAATPAALDALAYAPPPASPVDRANVVAASAPIPRSARPVLQARDNSVPATGIDTVAAKGVRGEDGQVSNSARIAAANTDGTWLRIIMLAPSVGASMQVTVLGDTDLTMMRTFFVKPASVIDIGFSNDPMMGMSCDRFSGSSNTKLETTSFVLRTAQR
jgi:hypothetical protein